MEQLEQWDQQVIAELLDLLALREKPEHKELLDL
jgi:hypothetical protein